MRRGLFLREGQLDMYMIKWLTNIIRWGNKLEDPSVPLTSANIASVLGNQSSAAGVSVSLESVLGNPAVRKAIDLISGKVAQCPLNLYCYGPNDGRIKDTQHPGYKALKRPSPYYTGYVFRRTLQAHACMGNGYAYIVRDAMAQPVELLILDPHATTLTNVQGVIQYHTTLNNRQYILPIEDVLHLRGLSLDGLTGINQLQMSRDALGLGLALQQYGATYFRNQASPRIIVSPPESIKGENLKQFREDWVQMFMGISNSGKPGFVPPGTTVTPIAQSNDEAQFLQSREFDLIAVANLFGIPPHKVGSKINVSYSSLESEEKAFLADSLESWLHTWEEECDATLLTENEKDNDVCYYEHDRKSLVQIEADKEIALLKMQFEGNMISWQEMRQKMNMSTEKDTNQTWFVDLAKAPAANLNNQPQAPAPSVTSAGQPADEAKKRLLGMTRAAVSRLLKRLEKSGGTIEDHRAVFVEALGTFDNAEAWTEDLFRSIGEELAAVLPEQRAEVLARLDIDKLTEELCQ